MPECEVSPMVIDNAYMRAVEIITEEVRKSDMEECDLEIIQVA